MIDTLYLYPMASPSQDPSSTSGAKRPALNAASQEGQAKHDYKKPRHGHAADNYLPTPMSKATSSLKAQDDQRLADGRRYEERQQRDLPAHSIESQAGDTQPMSQFSDLKCLVGSVEDEVAEGVWGYLIPLAYGAEEPLVLKSQDAASTSRQQTRQESVARGRRLGGFLVGRHRECDYTLVDKGTKISNRHFLLSRENKNGNAIVVLEDLSTNGTSINGQVVGRNCCRELRDGDEIACVQEVRFLFRYPASIVTSSHFRSQYELQKRLGGGQYASVHAAIEKHTGSIYAVKWFKKRPAGDQSLVNHSMRREIATLRSLDHPHLLCIKDSFDEDEGVFLILEMGEEDLFEMVCRDVRLSEDTTRRYMEQLLSATKYLHERNIIHRDIKLENVILTGGGENAKLADFGLAKIVGEDSFTTTLCGTPNYLAPEILGSNLERKYSRAVDIWSLGVVLYTCLCGFLPFSDELFGEDFPFTLVDQIRMGKVAYPSPSWDSIGDPALDLIDRMLYVDADSRITVEGCLDHPWLTGAYPPATESSQGLYEALLNMDFSDRRKTQARTSLESLRTFRVQPASGQTPNEQQLVIQEENSRAKAQQASKC